MTYVIVRTSEGQVRRGRMIHDGTKFVAQFDEPLVLEPGESVKTEIVYEDEPPDDDPRNQFRSGTHRWRG